MNTSYFIAKHIIKGKESKSIASPIMKIAIIGIAISMMVMILAVSIVLGFQKNIRDKVIGFGSHIQVVSYEGNLSFRSLPISKMQEFYLHPEGNDKIESIHVFAVQPGIVQDNETVEGVIVKGVDKDFNWDFFSNNLLEGRSLALKDSIESNEVIISSILKRRLRVSLKDTITVFFVRDKEEKPKAKDLIVVGVYDTGLSDFDEKFVLTDIKHIQNISKWGIRTFLKSNYNCENSLLTISSKTFGGTKEYLYKWGEDGEWQKKSELLINTYNFKDTVIRCISVDHHMNNQDKFIHFPDTAWLNIKKVIDSSSCMGVSFISTLKTTGGSQRYYVGGFEVLIKSFDDLEVLDEFIYNEIPVELNSRKITDIYPEVFNWLNILDTNVYVIIGLMIIVAVINMISALLVLILEKTTLIGVVKTLGMKNWEVRKMFLYTAFFILTRGMFYGNLLGFGLAFFQKTTGLFTLPASNYFMSEVPIEFNLIWLISINLGTVLVCILVLTLPSYLVTKITPVKAIKFE